MHHLEANVSLQALLRPRAARRRSKLFHDDNDIEGVTRRLTADDIETVSLQGHTFQEPRKRIVSPASLDRFEHSAAFAEILAFIRVCNTM